MNIIIAPDSFKSTASAPEVARHLATGIQRVWPEAQITVVPLADGGEGTAACFDGVTITLPTTDAAGRLTEASYVFDDGTTSGLTQAFIDVAAASGLPAVADNPVPLTGDTYGTGVLIADAIANGAQRITLGLGGTATIDGGTGILVALGAPAMNAAGHPLRQGGAALVDFDHFDTAQLNIPAAAAEWVLLTDVSAPATGPQGAAAVFGPQKGASETDVELLDRALATLCEKTGVDPHQPGFGAAGGLPIAITALSTIVHGTADHVHILPGADIVAESVGLDALIADADVVITGEGSFDHQSLLGKVTGMVLSRAQRAGKRAIVVAGALQDKPPAEVLGIELINDPDVEKQLVEAGERIGAALKAQ
ncbi:glycerate kinase [Corynebacterium epidermidicanis]|uniref:Glycerate kinase n=1 Tax=Corynebacterium epidermidicanis TaxID=1050174 RepID=A0A0G3GQH6_9CORY|nr:glycerate kinase [Corynebacterium epidermidicanis]AKK03456.1 glycerate kinase [Corynebacterium epidermidicanis]